MPSNINPANVGMITAVEGLALSMIFVAVSFRWMPATDGSCGAAVNSRRLWMVVRLACHEVMNASISTQTMKKTMHKTKLSLCITRSTINSSEI